MRLTIKLFMNLNLLYIIHKIEKKGKNKMKKIKLCGVSLLAILLILVGCSSSLDNKDSENNGNSMTEETLDDDIEKESEYPITWTTSFDGQEVDFTAEEAPKRAVSMSFATTEMMLALGLEDQMVGTAFREDDVLPEQEEAYNKVKVLSEKWPSYEVFMAEEPDFAAGWPVDFTKRALPAQQLIKENVNIYVPNSMVSLDADLEMNFRDLLMFGKIFDKQENAEKFVTEQKEKLEKVLENLKDLPEKRVFIFDSEDEQPFTVFEGYTTNILDLIGAKNVLSGKGSDQTWGQASWEDIVAENPEYFIIVDYSESIRNNDDFQDKVNRIKENPLLKDLDAVKNDNFIKVRLSEITPGVRTVDALERLATEIHGD